MPLPFPFDFKKPDYIEVFNWRLEKLQHIRDNPQFLPAIKQFYKDNPAQYIIDWGCTFDPNNLSLGLPAVIPFILFPQQEEWVHWFMECWKNGDAGLTMKSRQVGISWLAVAVATTLALFYQNLWIGFGSRKAEYVDNIGSPKSLFYKAREFIKRSPVEFRGPWNENLHSKKMLIEVPQTGSGLLGEGGDNLGRGATTAIYFVDESAFLPRPQLVEASLSQTTRCRIDISTPNGTNNPFAQKWLKGNIKKFAFHWRNDPRKDDDWYEKEKIKLNDPVIIAQELDMDLYSSIEGVVIEAKWIQAAIDAHKKLNIEIPNFNVLGLDIADEGADKNSPALRKFILLSHVWEWSGKGSDIFETIEKTCQLMDEHKVEYTLYDADGLGAGARGDVRMINTRRQENRLNALQFYPFRGSGAVIDPQGNPFTKNVNSSEIQTDSQDRTNKDYFENAKAQEWFRLRKRFINTFRAVNGEKDYNPDNLIALDSNLENLSDIITELGQPTFMMNDRGKIIINKQPNGARSPNRADAVMIAYSKLRKLPSIFDIKR